MKWNRILIALVAFLIIAALVLMREPLANLFTPSEEQQNLAQAKEAFKEAEKAVETATSDFERAGIEVQTKSEALVIATTKRDEASERLKELGQSNEDIEALVPEKNTTLRVEVVKSEAEPIASGIALSGRAEAARKVEVRAETSGQVISEPIASGTAVQKGDVLCELDPGTRQAALDQALAALSTAQTQYQSTKQLKDRGLASTAALQAANATLEQTQSGVDSAQKEIERLKIRAPFEGVLEAQTAELGTLLQPGTTCASLVALDRLIMVGYAAETQVDKISVGADAVGYLRDGEQLEGVVTFVAATADDITRTFRTEVSVQNSGNIRDGASARIEIALAGTQGHLIPQNALTLNDEGVLGLKLNQDNTAVFVPVEMVRDTPDGIWVTGLPQSAEVIIEGQEYATEGQAIEVVYFDEAQS